MEVKVLLWTL